MELSRELHCFSVYDEYFVFIADTLNLYKINPTIAPYFFGKSKLPVNLIRRLPGDIFVHPPKNQCSRDNQVYSSSNSLSLYVTYDCNMACSYCFEKDYHSQFKKRSMDFETARKAVDLIFRISDWNEREEIEINFFGGEPLLNMKVIKQVVEYAINKARNKNKSVGFTISTNGTLLNFKNMDFLKKYNFGILVSIDGPEDIHNKHRKFLSGSGTFKVIMDNLKDYKDDTFFIRATQGDKSISMAEQLNYLLNTFPAASVHVEPLFWGEKASCIDRKDVEKELSDFFKAVISNIPKQSYIRIRGIFHYFSILYFRNPSYWSCAFGKMIAVDPDGNIYPCQSAVGERKYLISNINDDYDINDIFLKYQTAPVQYLPFCKNCWARFLCAGGCYIAKDRMGEEIYKKYHCEYKKRLIEYILYLYWMLKENKPSDFIKLKEKLKNTVHRSNLSI